MEELQRGIAVRFGPGKMSFSDETARRGRLSKRFRILERLRDGNTRDRKLVEERRPNSHRLLGINKAKKNLASPSLAPCLLSHAEVRLSLRDDEVGSREDSLGRLTAVLPGEKEEKCHDSAGSFLFEQTRYRLARIIE